MMFVYGDRGAVRNFTPKIFPNIFTAFLSAFSPIFQINEGGN